MGIFGKKKHPLEGLSPYELKQGAQVELVEVAPSFIDFARTQPKAPRLGHEVSVGLVLNNGQVLVYHGNDLVAKMHPKFVPYYADDFAWLAQRNKFGLTNALIKPEAAKKPHALSLNWGSGVVGGGIL